MTRPSVGLVLLAALLAAVALSAAAGAGGAPDAEDLLLRNEQVSDAKGALEAADGLPDEELPTDDASAIDKVGELLAAAGGAVADATLAVIGAIGDGLAAVGNGLVALARLVGDGLTAVGHGFAVGARLSWDGLAWLALHTGNAIAWAATAIGTGLVAAAVFVGDLFVAIGTGLANAWPQDPKGQAIVASSAAAGTAAAGAGAWYTRPWRYLRYLPFLAPLYARISKEQLLEHPVRQGLHRAIGETPGIHISELSRVEELSWGTLLHHLDKLERAGLVVSTNQAGKRCFFLPGQVPREQRTILPALENEKARSLAEYFATNPGATQKDASDALGLSAALVSWHIKRLEKAGVLTRTRVGRTQQVGLTGEALDVVAA